MAVTLVLLAAGTLATPLPQFIAAAAERWLAPRVTLTREWRIVLFGHGATAVLFALTAGLNEWCGGRRRGAAPLGLGRPTAWQMRIGLLASLPVIAGLALTALIPGAQVRIAAGARYLAPQILIDTAFREELVFRGFLHPVFRRRLRPWTAAFAGGVIFSLMHLPGIWRLYGGLTPVIPWGPLTRTLVYAALWGAGTARLAEAGGGVIWAPVLAHLVTDSHALIDGWYPLRLSVAGWIIPVAQFTGVAVLLALVRRSPAGGRRRATGVRH